MIYFDRVEVVNLLAAESGNFWIFHFRLHGLVEGHTYLQSPKTTTHIQGGYTSGGMLSNRGMLRQMGVDVIFTTQEHT